MDEFDYNIDHQAVTLWRLKRLYFNIPANKRDIINNIIPKYNNLGCIPIYGKKHIISPHPKFHIGNFTISEIFNNSVIYDEEKFQVIFYGDEDMADYNKIKSLSATDCTEDLWCILCNDGYTNNHDTCYTECGHKYHTSCFLHYANNYCPKCKKQLNDRATFQITDFLIITLGIVTGAYIVKNLIKN